MIEICNLNMKIGQKEILKNINLSVKKGEIIAIIGPSGAGKSSLLRSINLLESPQSGAIKIEDVALNYARFTSKEVLNLRRKSAMVFQNHNLFINKNCLENVAEALIVAQKMPKNKAFEIALESLKKVGLEGKARAFSHELSGGQAQRVGIARALAINTPILLLDEPTSALDPELVSEVLESIRAIALNRTKTMLIVTHELGFGRAIADKIVFMCDGEILKISDTSEFFSPCDDSKNARITQFLSKMHDYKKYV